MRFPVLFFRNFNARTVHTKSVYLSSVADWVYAAWFLVLVHFCLRRKTKCLAVFISSRTLPAGDVHVHIHFDPPAPQLPQSRSTSPACLSAADSRSLDRPQTAHQAQQMPPLHTSLGPASLPLQPMTRLVAFDDSLADLVSEVESLVSHPGCSIPHTERALQQGTLERMAGGEGLGSLAPFQFACAEHRVQLQPVCLAQQQPSADASNSRKAATMSSSGSHSSEQSVNMAQGADHTVCCSVFAMYCTLLLCFAGGRVECMGLHVCYSRDRGPVKESTNQALMCVGGGFKLNSFKLQLLSCKSRNICDCSLWAIVCAASFLWQSTSCERDDL